LSVFKRAGSNPQDDGMLGAGAANLTSEALYKQMLQKEFLAVTLWLADGLGKTDAITKQLQGWTCSFTDISGSLSALKAEVEGICKDPKTHSPLSHSWRERVKEAQEKCGAEHVLTSRLAGSQIDNVLKRLSCSLAAELESYCPTSEESDVLPAIAALFDFRLCGDEKVLTNGLTSAAFGPARQKVAEHYSEHPVLARVAAEHE
jgi:hypothetical protein